MCGKKDMLLAVVAHEYQRTEKSMWVHEINLKPDCAWVYFHLFPDLLNDEKTFFKFCRTLADKFMSVSSSYSSRKRTQSTSQATSCNFSPLTKCNHSPPPPFGISLKTYLAGQRALEHQHLSCRAEPAPIQCKVSHKITCISSLLDGATLSRPIPFRSSVCPA